MKNRLLKNLGLKILSVFVAFLIWIMVMNVDDPEQTRSYVISEQRIQRINVEEAQASAEKAESGKKVYSVVRDDDESGSVIVYVTARRSVLDRLQLSDIKVVADMQNMTLQNTVPYKITVPGVKQEDIKSDPNVMKFVLEDKSETTHAISLSTNGKPASGYELGSVTLEEGDSVIIAGPVSITRIIDKVAVQVSVSGLNSDQTVEASIVITDKNGSNLSKTQMESLEIKTSNGALIKDNTVNARVTLWKVHENIRLKVSTDEIEMGSGYHITSVTVNPSTINLAGSEAMMEALNGEFVIEGIKRYGVMESIEQNIDLSEYLRENYSKTLKLESDAATAVSVKIQVEKVGTTTVNVPVSDFEIVGQPDEMKVVLTPADKMPIEVNVEDGAAIRAEDIQVTLDLTEYQTEGNYTVPLEVVLPEGCQLEKEPSIKVNLEKIEIETEMTETTVEE